MFAGGGALDTAGVAAGAADDGFDGDGGAASGGDAGGLVAGGGAGVGADADDDVVATGASTDFAVDRPKTYHTPARRPTTMTAAATRTGAIEDEVDFCPESAGADGRGSAMTGGALMVGIGAGAGAATVLCPAGAMGGAATGSGGAV